VDIHQAKIQAMMETSLEKSEAMDLGADTKEIEFESEHQEVSKEEVLEHWRADMRICIYL
jgi:hypothetical protein